MHILSSEDIRKHFPILRREVRGGPLVYLDNASTTLKPQVVADAVHRHYLMETSNVHRGVHELSEKATENYEATRRDVARFLNAKRHEEIIFTAGTTSGINMLAQALGQSYLKAGDEIILTQLEHHANIVPWQMLCQRLGCVIKVAPINQNGEIILDEYKKLFTPRTKLVSTTYVSNAIGSIVPLKEMIAIAHDNGARIVVDAAQAVAHMPVNVQELDCDYLVFSGHKIFAPTGSGVLYGKFSYLDALPPVIGGGAMIQQVSFEKTTYACLPERLEAGTPNISGVLGLGEAIRFVNQIGFPTIQAQEEKLFTYASEKLKKIPGLTMIGNAENKAAIFSFTMKGIHPHDMGTLLDQHGVAIRSGHHCCQPLMKFYQVPATSRASFSFYNNEDDVDALDAAIRGAREVFGL